MRIGFIGAGKMGFTLGKHLKLYEDSLETDGNSLYRVVGYYSRTLESAIEAARFTDTNYYESLEGLVSECDTLILTVPDSQIPIVADKLKQLGDLVRDKIIIHTSGALSSQVFSGMNGIYAYSIHPIYAVSSKTESYINFNQCFITIEGSDRYLGRLVDIFAEIGHKVKIISCKDKVKYHSGAVFASNLVIGLYQMAQDILMQCGFSAEESDEALKPLFLNNAKRLEDKCPADALTGPIERGDVETVRGHLNVLTDEYNEVYRLLSTRLAWLMQDARHSDYDRMFNVLEKDKIEKEK